MNLKIMTMTMAVKLTGDDVEDDEDDYDDAQDDLVQGNVKTNL